MSAKASRTKTFGVRFIVMECAILTNFALIDLEYIKKLVCNVFLIVTCARPHSKLLMKAL